MVGYLGGIQRGQGVVARQGSVIFDGETRRHAISELVLYLFVSPSPRHPVSQSWFHHVSRSPHLRVTEKRYSMERSTLQHRLNSLHLYCRLRPYLGQRLARVVASSWEQTRIYRALYVSGVPCSAWGKGAGRTATS
jgi:hypothetical protein